MLIRSISILFFSTWVLVMPAQAAGGLCSASHAARPEERRVGEEVWGGGSTGSGARSEQT